MITNPCHNCSIRPARLDKVECQVCSDASRAEYQRRKQIGICPRCGKNPFSDKVCCVPCQLEQRLRTSKLPKNEREKARQAFQTFDGHCHVCGVTEPGWRLGWCLDHCHATNTFRGILCGSCNNALGRVKDDPRILLALVQYLARHQDPHPVD